ncbi:hypothetical protein TNCV_5096301 [Trichonephila clavipes]|nr:hypothetical protein TNCV_5096301 [Trichonephila clavipes]
MGFDATSKIQPRHGAFGLLPIFIFDGTIFHSNEESSIVDVCTCGFETKVIPEKKGVFADIPQYCKRLLMERANADGWPTDRICCEIISGVSERSIHCGQYARHHVQ